MRAIKQPKSVQSEPEGSPEIRKSRRIKAQQSPIHSECPDDRRHQVGGRERPRTAYRTRVPTFNDSESEDDQPQSKDSDRLRFMEMQVDSLFPEEHPSDDDDAGAGGFDENDVSSNSPQRTKQVDLRPSRAALREPRRSSSRPARLRVAGTAPAPDWDTSSSDRNSSPAPHPSLHPPVLRTRRSYSQAAVASPVASTASEPPSPVPQARVSTRHSRMSEPHPDFALAPVDFDYYATCDLPMVALDKSRYRSMTNATRCQSQIRDFFKAPVGGIMSGPMDTGFGSCGIVMEASLRKLIGGQLDGDLKDAVGWKGKLNYYTMCLRQRRILDAEQASLALIDDYMSKLDSDGDELSEDEGRASRSKRVRRHSSAVGAEERTGRTRTTNARSRYQQRERSPTESLSRSPSRSTVRSPARSTQSSNSIQTTNRTRFPVLGKLGREAEEAWNSSEEVRVLHAKKPYLASGLYSQEHKLDPELRERYRKQRRVGQVYSEFKFPPLLHLGERMIDEEQEFIVPYDIQLYVDSMGGPQMCRTILTASDTDHKPSPFRKVRANIFVDRPPRKAKEAPVCVCMPPADGGLGCLEDCLNRCMFIECDVKTCPCGSQCSNQAFQRRDEVKELEVHWTQARGYGLRTNVDIPKGTLVHEYRGEVISQQTCLDRMSTIYKDQTCCYFLNYANGEVIDACQKGTVARFVNHSCDPNCHIEKWFINGEFGVGLFSSVDIPKGTELTYDYRFDAFGPMQKCFCGATKCRGYIGVSKADAEAREKIATKTGTSAATKGKRHVRRAHQSSTAGDERDFWVRKQQFDRLQYQFKDIMKHRASFLHTRLFLIRNLRSRLCKDIRLRQSASANGTLLPDSVSIYATTSKRSSVRKADEGVQFALESPTSEAAATKEMLVERRSRSINQILEDLRMSAEATKKHSTDDMDGLFDEPLCGFARADEFAVPEAASAVQLNRLPSENLLRMDLDLDFDLSVDVSRTCSDTDSMGSPSIEHLRLFNESVAAREAGGSDGAAKTAQSPSPIGKENIEVQKATAGESQKRKSRKPPRPSISERDYWVRKHYYERLEDQYKRAVRNREYHSSARIFLVRNLEKQYLKRLHEFPKPAAANSQAPSTRRKRTQSAPESEVVFVKRPRKPMAKILEDLAAAAQLDPASQTAVQLCMIDSAADLDGHACLDVDELPGETTKAASKGSLKAQERVCSAESNSSDDDPSIGVYQAGDKPQPAKASGASQQHNGWRVQRPTRTLFHGDL